MTTRRVRGTDRTASAVVGVALVAAGAAAWDWRTRTTGLLPDGPLDLSGVEAALDSTWWPWAFAGVGVMLGVLGLWWLLAHVPRIGAARSRLADSGATGRLEVDLSALGSTLADRWESLAPVTGVRSRTMPEAPDVLVLTGHVDIEADPADLVEATRRLESEVTDAFPDGEVRVRFLVEGPARQPRTRRSTDITVDESSSRGAVNSA